MHPLLGLLRPGNAVLSAAAVVVGAIVAVGIEGTVALATPVVLGAGVVFLFTGAGNALNDYFDRDVDRVNHPGRPIPSGRVAPGTAVRVSGALFAASVVIGAAINLPSLGVVVLSLALMLAYELRFKRSGGSGNLLIAWLVGSLFLFAGTVVFEGDLRPLQVASTLALLAGLSTLGREIAKDIEDVAGDRDRQTLPKRIGVARSGTLARAALLSAVALSGLPALTGILSLSYAAIVAIADAIFIYAALVATRAPGKSERAMKAAMVVALVAFLAGGFG